MSTIPLCRDVLQRVSTTNNENVHAMARLYNNDKKTIVINTPQKNHERSRKKSPCAAA